MSNTDSPYSMAQIAVAQLKSAIYRLLKERDGVGMKNSEIGRSLGIYMGHVEHKGHVSLTMLTLMEAEGVVEQNKDTKIWSLKHH